MAHALWNALIKAEKDQRLTAIIMLSLCSAVPALPLIAVLPFPSASVWFWLALSTAVHTLYKYLLIASYARADYGHVYPIARGGAPMLAAFAAFVWLGEAPSVLAWGAIALIVLGIVSLAPLRDAGAGHALALLTACSIASYTVIDAAGVRHAQTALVYVSWLAVCDGLSMTLTAAALGKFSLAPAHTPLRQLALWRRGLMSGGLAVGGYFLVLWALLAAPVGAVSALRETSVIFAALISTLILREGQGRRKILAAVLACSGIILLLTAS